MSQAPIQPRNLLAPVIAAALSLSSPILCHAATQATLPWDETLNIAQNFLIGPLAHSVLVISAVVAMLAFALAGDSELVRRFAKTVLGTGVALIAVRLLNYLVP